MSKSLYLVIQSRNAWWVDLEGHASGPYATREDAAMEARDQARFAAHSGEDGEVLVPDEEGRYWVVWSSDHDLADANFVPRRFGARSSHIS